MALGPRRAAIVGEEERKREREREVPTCICIIHNCEQFETYLPPSFYLHTSTCGFLPLSLSLSTRPSMVCILDAACTKSRVLLV